MRMGKQDMTGKMVKKVTDSKRRLEVRLTGMVAVMLMLVTATAVHAQFFETAGKSARIVGMNEVFLASSGEAASYWYNPAGLAKYSSRQVGITYGVPAATVSDLNISQINFVTPIGENSGVGFGISYGGIDVANELVISGGYGIAVNDRLSLGGNVKIMRWAADG